MTPRGFVSTSLLRGILIGIAMAVLTLVIAQWFPK